MEGNTAKLDKSMRKGQFLSFLEEFETEIKDFIKMSVSKAVQELKNDDKEKKSLFLTSEQASEMLKFNDKHFKALRKLAKEQNWTYEKVGRKKMYVAAEIKRYMEGRLI